MKVRGLSAPLASSGLRRTRGGVDRGDGQDLSLGRTAGAWSVTASLRNGFDQRLFGVAGDTRYLPLLPGRTLEGAATRTLP